MTDAYGLIYNGANYCNIERTICHGKVELLLFFSVLLSLKLVVPAGAEAVQVKKLRSGRVWLLLL